MQQGANRTFGQLDPVALLDHPRQIDPPPAHDAMLGQVWPAPNQVGYLLLLRGRQPRLRAGSGPIVQSLQTFGVIAVDPIA